MTTPDRHALITRSWRLTDADGDVLQPELWLLIDGRIAGVRGRLGPRMHRWDIVDCRLVFRDRVGRATARLESAADEDGRAFGTGARARLSGRTSAGAALLLEDRPPGAGATPGGRAQALAGMGAAPARRNLVVLHAGAASAHPGWPHDIGIEDRNWDLCIVWHDDPDGHPDDPGAQSHVVQHGVPKWPALLALAGPSSPIARYDHVMVLDDDLDWRWSSINLAFGIARDHDLALAHPAFDPAGRVDRAAAVLEPKARLRFATAIPTAAAMFSRDALAACLPTLAGGLDGPALADAWVARLGRPLHRIAILDETPVRARPRAAAGPVETDADDLAIVGTIDRDWPLPAS